MGKIFVKFDFPITNIKNNEYNSSLYYTIKEEQNIKLVNDENEYNEIIKFYDLINLGINKILD